MWFRFWSPQCCRRSSVLMHYMITAIPILFFFFWIKKLISCLRVFIFLFIVQSILMGLWFGFDRFMLFLLFYYFCWNVDEDNSKACFSKHSQWPPKSFRLRRAWELLLLQSFLGCLRLNFLFHWQFSFEIDLNLSMKFQNCNASFISCRCIQSQISVLFFHLWIFFCKFASIWLMFVCIWFVLGDPLMIILKLMVFIPAFH